LQTGYAQIQRGFKGGESLTFGSLRAASFPDGGKFYQGGAGVSLLPRIFNRSAAANPGEGGFWNRTVQALSTVLHLRMVNAYRDQFNPLRGLTIRRAIQYLEDGERGAYADVQWLYRKIEKRDPTLKGLIERYEGGLLKLEWEICTVDEDDLPKGCTPEMAEKQAEALRAAYDRIDNLQQALQFLILADFRGYSHLEKHREDGGVFHLEPVDQWYWVRDGINGAWQYNQKAVGERRVGWRLTRSGCCEISLFARCRGR
jgi:hypothetical protein